MTLCPQCWTFSKIFCYCFWTTAIISGVFLFTHITNLTQMLEAKFPFLMKLVI